MNEDENPNMIDVLPKKMSERLNGKRINRDALCKYMKETLDSLAVSHIADGFGGMNDDRTMVLLSLVQFLWNEKERNAKKTDLNDKSKVVDVDEYERLVNALKSAKYCLENRGCSAYTTENTLLKINKALAIPTPTGNRVTETAEMEDDWTEICAKCSEGEIEPQYCEYYGEPNGCNSPTYQKHPKIYNNAAIRKAIQSILNLAYEVANETEEPRAKISNDWLIETCKTALAAPARNCDVEYADRVEMYYAFKDWCKAKGHTMEPMLASDAFDWLLATAAERKG